MASETQEKLQELSEKMKKMKEQMMNQAVEASWLAAEIETLAKLLKSQEDTDR